MTGLGLVRHHGRTLVEVRLEAVRGVPFELPEGHHGVLLAAGTRSPGAIGVQKTTVSLFAELLILQHCDAEGGDLDAECSLWTKAPVGRPAAI